MNVFTQRVIAVARVLTNADFEQQPVTHTAIHTALSGATLATQTRTTSVTLGPLRSYAFVTRLLTAVPGERARLEVTLNGSRGAPTSTQRRTYQVIVSPSGG